DLAKEILKIHDPICSNRPESSVARGIYDCEDIAFSTYGEYWRRVKSICVNQLLSIRKVQSFRNVREEEVSVMLEKSRQFGFCWVVSKSGSYVPWLVWVKYVNGMNRKVRGVEEDLDEFLDFVVKEHLKGGGIRGNEKDFVDVLLDIRRNDEGGFVLEESSIKALVLVMFALRFTRFLRNSVELVLANVVLSFEFELPGGASGEDLDMREGDGLTIHRKFPLKVVARCESLP
ncbi:hypothetical protein MIMGU_mgv1a019421mg, partial [Erythranthe guttata]